MDKTIHKLKTWPAYFLGLRLGMKNFEVRVNDRDYQVGDFLLLQEFIPSIGYTGKEIERQITYILKGGEFGIAEDTVVMSLSQWPPQQAVSDEEIEAAALKWALDNSNGADNEALYHKMKDFTGGAKWMRDRTAPSEAETILRELLWFHDAWVEPTQPSFSDDLNRKYSEIISRTRKWCADNQK